MLYLRFRIPVVVLSVSLLVSVQVFGQQAGEMPAPTPSVNPVKAPPAKKKGKVEYTGPNTIVELPPTPMIDAEGKQQLDPDAKPMFNAPIKQKRDKKGHPLFDEAGKPIFQTADDLGFDEKGKKIHTKKVKPPKAVSVSIERGTMTVDGMTGKAALNYQIADLKYIYLYAPWVGIVVVSNEPFPGAKAQPNAFNDKSLTVSVGDHILEVASEKRLLGKKPQPAFVLVDRDFQLSTKSPVMGYGPIRKPPYAWPGSKQNTALNSKAPPLPQNLLPTQLMAPCPTGQMRVAARTPLPGETSLPQPCVPIGKSKTATAAASTAP